MSEPSGASPLQARTTSVPRSAGRVSVEVEVTARPYRRGPAPPEWLAAVRERGYAYLVFTTRAWPEGEPGKPVEPAALAAFAGAEETLRAAAHVILPAGSLRG